jgi:hypothetical protein
LVGCSFDGTSLRALGGFTRFVNCTFRNVRVTKPAPDYLEFVDCTFTGRLTGLHFWGAPLDAPDRYRRHATSLARRGLPPPPAAVESLMLRPHNDISGNDFSQATLIDVNFRFGVDLTLQKLPSGPDYIYVPDAAAALPRAQATLTDDRARAFLQRLLDREVAQGQHQLWLRPADFTRKGEVPAHIVLATEALR